jgi:predicted CoA-binding protein
MPDSELSRDELLEIYRDARRIAVVGASASPGKAAHDIPQYLESQGYEIFPVNPRGGEVVGVPARRSLAEIAGPVDVVDVFRPREEAEQVAKDAVAIHAKVLWFQPDTDTEAAVELARRAGLKVVQGICMGATHRKLGLGPGPVGH